MAASPQAPQRRTSLSVAIVGAGLSGLCLAQALLRMGCDVHVYERDAAPDARRQGYRITVDRYGTAALKRCLPPQVFELARATASAPEEVGYFRFTNQQLGEIFKLTFRRDSRQETPEMLGQVDRATLRAIALAGLGERVQYDRAGVRVEPGATGATLRFADGGATQADLVVAADGAHSALRAQLLPGSPVRDTGFRGIYGKTPLLQEGASLVPEALVNSGVFAIGPDGHAFFFTSMRFNESPQVAFARLAPQQTPPISADYVMWAVLLPENALTADQWQGDPQALHSAALEAARPFHPALQRMVARAEVEYTQAVTLTAATQPQAWPAAPVALMGDAAHVMPPTGAHGGNTALRDAATLAEKLQDVLRGADLERAIAAYHAEMADYAFKEVASSLAMLRRSEMRNPLMRFTMLRAVPWVRSLSGAAPVVPAPAGM